MYNQQYGASLNPIQQRNPALGQVPSSFGTPQHSPSRLASPMKFSTPQAGSGGNHPYNRPDDGYAFDRQQHPHQHQHQHQHPQQQHQQQWKQGYRPPPRDGMQQQHQAPQHQGIQPQQGENQGRWNPTQVATSPYYQYDARHRHHLLPPSPSQPRAANYGYAGNGEGNMGGNMLPHTHFAPAPPNNNGNRAPYSAASSLAPHAVSREVIDLPTEAPPDHGPPQGHMSPKKHHQQAMANALLPKALQDYSPTTSPPLGFPRKFPLKPVSRETDNLDLSKAFDGGAGDSEADERFSGGNTEPSSKRWLKFGAGGSEGDLKGGTGMLTSGSVELSGMSMRAGSSLGHEQEMHAQQNAEVLSRSESVSPTEWQGKEADKQRGDEGNSNAVEEFALDELEGVIEALKKERQDLEKFKEEEVTKEMATLLSRQNTSPQIDRSVRHAQGGASAGGPSSAVVSQSNHMAVPALQFGANQPAGPGDSTPLQAMRSPLDVQLLSRPAAEGHVQNHQAPANHHEASHLSSPATAPAFGLSTTASPYSSPRKHPVHAYPYPAALTSNLPWGRVLAQGGGEAMSSPRPHEQHQAYDHSSPQRLDHPRGYVSAQPHDYSYEAAIRQRRDSKSRSVVSEGFEWEIQAEQLTFSRRLGSGSFGEVFMASWMGSEAAVKRVRLKSTLEEEVLADFRSEVDILSKVRHVNCVLFLGASSHPPELMIVTEYVERGSLHEVLHNPNEAFEWPLRLKIAQQTAAGVLYLHSRSSPIVHRDLKSENILLTANFTVKICDFGLARLKIHSSNIETRHANAGTPAWMAPEVLRGETFNEKADVFSFGVVLWELLSRMEPWADKKPVQIMSLVGVMNQRLPLPSSPPHPECPPLFIQLIKDCWEALPQDRPDFWKLAEHLSWIQMSSHSRGEQARQHAGY